MQRAAQPEEYEEYEEHVEDLISEIVARANDMCGRAVKHWKDQLESLLLEHKSLGKSVIDVQEKLGRAAAPSESKFWSGQAVEIFWQYDQMWYPAVVCNVHEDYRVDVRFTLDGWWECMLRGHHPENVRPQDQRMLG